MENLEQALITQRSKWMGLVEDADSKLEELRIKNQMPSLKKKFEGKFFKYRNSYSCPQKPSDYWFLYTYIEQVKDLRSGKGFQFETCTYNKTTIDRQDVFLNNIGERITKREFMKAYNKMLRSIPKP